MADALSRFWAQQTPRKRPEAPCVRRSSKTGSRSGLAYQPNIQAIVRGIAKIAPGFSTSHPRRPLLPSCRWCARAASPFEGLAERMNWLHVQPDQDAFGKRLLKAGIDLDTIRAWSVDPQV